MEAKDYATEKPMDHWRIQRDEEFRKYLETNENGNMMIQSPWEAVKAVLRGKFIVIQAYLRKQEKSQTA